jgi:hypothetical protein
MAKQIKFSAPDVKIIVASILPLWEDFNKSLSLELAEHPNLKGREKNVVDYIVKLVEKVKETGTQLGSEGYADVPILHLSKENFPTVVRAFLEQGPGILMAGSTKGKDARRIGVQSVRESFEGHLSCSMY